MKGGKFIFNLLIVAVVVVLLYFGYRMLVNNASTPSLNPTGTANNDTGNSKGGVDDEFLATLVGLQGLNLEGEIFNNPIFQSLVDANTILPEETPGRANPFAPVNFSALSPNVRTVATSTRDTILNSLPGGN